MRKFLTSALAAVTFGGAVVAAAVPAEARPYYGHGGYYYGHRHHGSNDAAVAAVAGIAGLAIGAAIADGNRGSRGYSSSYYRNGYSYDPRYEGYYGDYYGPRDRVCISRERVWDPYIGRHVTIERRYPC